MLLIVFLVLFPYLTFIFLAETLNPFTRPRNLIRRSHWKFGVKWAMAVFGGGCGSLFLMGAGNQSLIIAILAGIALALFMGVLLTYRKIAESF